MIKLRLVGASADLENLIYTSAKKGRKGSHIAPIDDALYDVLEDVYVKKKRRQKAEQAAKRAAEPPVTSKIPPRDIQKLLRAGRTVEQVARLAGVPVAYVERFRGPVRDEQLGIIQEFQSLRFTKPRLGESAVAIGEAVARNLRTRGVEVDEDSLADWWTASRTDGNPWTLAIRFRARGREQRAAWRFDPPSRSIVALNPLAADLAYSTRAAAPKAKPAAKPATAKRAKPAARRKRPVVRKKPVARKKPGARRRPPARKKPGARSKKVAARRKPAVRRKVAARKTPSSRRRPAAKKRTSRARPSKGRSRRR